MDPKVKDHSVVYQDAESFFSIGGSIWMKLSRPAAIKVCEVAAQRGILVARIEGGVWRFPGFEARLDCIWNGADPPLSVEDAERNNRLARKFIEESDAISDVIHDVFILTAPPITGWPH